jgi:hypothetical protein
MESTRRTHLFWSKQRNQLDFRSHSFLIHFCHYKKTDSTRAGSYESDQYRQRTFFHCNYMSLFYARWQRLQAMGERVTTVENLVQSNGSLTCSGLKGNCGLYHATPLINGEPSYYCWWRRRHANESCPPPLSNPCVDCQNISSNARYLADLWHRTGIDVVVPDTTNLRQANDVVNDELNSRPVEVLAEELASLRAQGMATPQLAPWTVAAANTTVYESLLRIMNTPTVAPLFLREAAGAARAVFFVHGDAPLRADPNTVKAIERNYGFNNISVIEMWANISPDDAVSARRALSRARAHTE